MNILANTGQVLQIGRLGENIYTVVQFDISEYLSEYPNATALLLNMRPGGSTAYPVPNTTTDDQYLYWTVSSADLTVKGMGYCELVIQDGEVVAKSIIYPTCVKDALDGSGDAPDDWDTWLSQFETLASQTISNAASAARDAESALDAATTAVNAADSASQSEQTAVSSAEIATESATAAESWAVGGTGSRPGEDTDNAKHYAEVAQQGAQESGYAWFDIDDSTGLMMVTITENLAEDVTFSINEQTGELEVIV